jgi:hypothetical protein
VALLRGRGESYRQAQSDAYQKLLGYLQQYQQGYLSALNTNTGNLTNAIGAAATRQANLNQGSAGVTAHETSPGSGIYVDPSGNLYNHDGTTYTPQNNQPPPASTPAPTPGFASPDVGYQQIARNANHFLAA